MKYACIHGRGKTACAICNPIYTIKKYIANRLYLLKYYIGKANIRYLGCSVEKLKTLIERKFNDRINWETYKIYWSISYTSRDTIKDKKTAIESLHYSNIVIKTHNSMQMIEVSKLDSK
jgi:hypothetical protein